MQIHKHNTNSNIVVRTIPAVLRPVVSLGVIVAAVSGFAFGQDRSPPHADFGLSFRNAALEERFTRSRSETEPVAKTLLNSSVTGQQTTVTKTRLRILPSTDGIRFDVLNSGDVSSQTTGINSQALVESSGQQHFEAIKPFWFDGNQFLTKPAYGTVEASQTPQRVVSAVGARMPILSGVGDRIAWNQVVRRSGEINRVVAEDVSRDVFPKVDRIVDNDFADLGQQWKNLQSLAAPLSTGIKPTWVARSGQTVSSIWSVNASSTSSTADVPRSLRTLESGEDLAFFVSEDSVNELLARYVRGGMTISDQQLQTLQSSLEPRKDESLSHIMARLQSTIRKLQSEKSDALLFSVELPEKRPLQVRFRDGDIRFVATFQVHPMIGSASGWMTTSFNFRGKRLSDRDWTMSVRGVEVNPLDAATDQKSVAGSPEPDLRIPAADEKPQDVTTVQAGTAWDTVIRTAVDGLSRKIPETPLPLEFSSGDALPGAKSLRIVQVDSDRGVLRCSFRFR